MPEELEKLIDIARIKYLAKELQIEKIASRKTSVVFTFKPNSKENQFEIDIPSLIKEYGTKIKFSAGIKQMITLEIGNNNEKKILKDVKNFLECLGGLFWDRHKLSQMG